MGLGQEMKPNEFVATVGKLKASAILRTNDEESARRAMDAAVQGGFRVIEFTFTVPGVIDLIREFSQRDGLIVGAGTVLTVEDAHKAVEAGASYLVSPVVDEKIIQTARELGVTAMPGCSTPTEMLAAYRAGAGLQKLFPGQGIGPAWVQQTLGPLPFLKIVPTSGVTLENARDYLKAGSYALGFVNSLFGPDDIAQGRFDVITDRARQMLEVVSGG